MPMHCTGITTLPINLFTRWVAYTSHACLWCFNASKGGGVEQCRVHCADNKTLPINPENSAEAYTSHAYHHASMHQGGEGVWTVPSALDWQ